LNIADNAIPNPQTIALLGTGTGKAAGSGLIQLAPSSVAFGNQQVSTASASQTVTLTNTGTAALSITGVSVTGSNGSDFAETNTCPVSLAVGASCSIKVIFTPSTSGGESATLTVTGGSNAPQTVALTGTGTVAASSGSGSGDFALTPVAAGVSVIQGSTAVYSLTVTPNAGAKDTITFSCSGPVGSNCSVSPASLTLDGVTAPTVKLSVDTTGGNGTAARLIPAGLAKSIFLAVLPFSFMGILLIGKRRGVLTALVLILLSLVLGSVSCGGSGSGSTTASSQLAPGTYQVIFIATSGGTSQNVPLNLVVNKK
jgi:hypothetical protein